MTPPPPVADVAAKKDSLFLFPPFLHSRHSTEEAPIVTSMSRDGTEASRDGAGMGRG